jgi:putative phosphonate metabolism protein
MAARYAIYFAPAPDSPFWQFGSAWLGRDAALDTPLPRPKLEGDASADWDGAALETLTGSPRNYGFHATLKPPFRLAEGQAVEGLIQAAESFARAQHSFDCSSVGVAALGRFIAFRMIAPCQAMADLAAACVRTFEPFRAPLNAAELAKRHAADLTPRQTTLTAEWGYPYVFEEFRFHMTLTGAIADDTARERLAASLRVMAEAEGACGVMRADAIAVYEQPAPGAPFRLLRRIPFHA